VTSGRHRRAWITRKIGEELHPDCIVECTHKLDDFRLIGQHVNGISHLEVCYQNAWEVLAKYNRLTDQNHEIYAARHPIESLPAKALVYQFMDARRRVLHSYHIGNKQDNLGE
jgi:hypothetical protein